MLMIVSCVNFGFGLGRLVCGLVVVIVCGVLFSRKVYGLCLFCVLVISGLCVLILVLLGG